MDNQDMRLQFITPDTVSELDVPVTSSGVSAGFPSPADDHLLNRILVHNPAATFLTRMSGDSMKDDCVCDGNLLVVDKSIEPYDGGVAVCFPGGEFTLKRVHMDKGRITLMPANKRYKPIEVNPDDDFSVWGIVTYSIQKL